MVGHSLRAAALLAVLSLAGCAGKGADAPGDGSVIEFQSATNTATTGSISGVVVDEGIRPLGNVTLTVSGQPDSLRTDANGRFVASGLKPGIYTVRSQPATVAGKRYLAVQTTAEVKAGETTKVRMEMPMDPAPQPYHGSTVKFDGFYDVSSGFADEVLDLAVWNHTYGPATLPQSPGCSCRFSFFADPGNVSAVVVDLVWTEPSPGNPMPEFWTLDLSYPSGSAPLHFCEDGSPCNAHINKAGNFTDADRSFSLGVWTDPSWVYVNQKFELFATVFYVAPPPPHWSALKDK